MVTLVSMVAALILIAGSWIAVQTSPDREAANDARIVARSIGPLVEAGGERDTLNVILQALAQGKIRAQIGPGPFAPEPAYRIEGIGPSLRGLGYVAIVGPDDRVIASSDPSGSAFDPPERAEWAPIVAAARSGERNTARLTVRREGAGPLALGAYPIGGAVMDGPPWLRGGPDEPTAVVVVAKTEISEPSPFRAIVRGIAIFTAATIAVLGSAFLFALGSAALVGYVLSRQLVRRLERLSGAVEALANGDLGRRVEEGRDDEVGQLEPPLQRDGRSAGDDRRGAGRAHPRGRGGAGGEARAGRQRLARAADAAGLDQRPRRVAAAAGRGGVAGAARGVVDGAPPRGPPVEPPGGRPVPALDDGVRRPAARDPRGRRRRRPGGGRGHASGRWLGARDRSRSSRTSRRGCRRLRATASGSSRCSATWSATPCATPPRAGSSRCGRPGRATLIRVTVEDTGAGIPPEQLARIFERFYRGDEARDRASGGAGLGLAIVRELVEAMGGSVAAESVVGEGSRFSFTLRVADAADGAARKADAGLTRA